MPVVFVYGTLRAGEVNDLNAAARAHGIAAPRLLGRAAVPGRLYDFGSYPGLVLDAAAPAVAGDLYEVDAALMPVLDEIEEVYPGQASLFVREERAVSAAGGPVTCLLYPVAEAAVAGLPRIASGDWVAYRREREAGLRQA
ncbi:MULTISPECIES: gamma-glutamylcyclotransferase family protein [Cupriavidus]